MKRTSAFFILIARVLTCAIILSGIIASNSYAAEMTEESGSTEQEETVIVYAYENEVDPTPDEEATYEEFSSTEEDYGDTSSSTSDQNEDCDDTYSDKISVVIHSEKEAEIVDKIFESKDALEVIEKFEENNITDYSYNVQIDDATYISKSTPIDIPEEKTSESKQSKNEEKTVPSESCESTDYGHSGSFMDETGKYLIYWKYDESSKKITVWSNENIQYMNVRLIIIIIFI